MHLQYFGWFLAVMRIHMNYNTIRILDPKILHTDPNPYLEIFYTDPWKKKTNFFPKNWTFQNKKEKKSWILKEILKMQE